ncbi:MAG: hypothetical protein AB7F59_05195 [Bdellovibrionales bacterium]
MKSMMIVFAFLSAASAYADNGFILQKGVMVYSTQTLRVPEQNGLKQNKEYRFTLQHIEDYADIVEFKDTGVKLHFSDKNALGEPQSGRIALVNFLSLLNEGKIKAIGAKKVEMNFTGFCLAYVRKDDTQVLVLGSALADVKSLADIKQDNCKLID